MILVEISLHNTFDFHRCLGSCVHLGAFSKQLVIEQNDSQSGAKQSIKTGMARLQLVI